MIDRTVLSQRSQTLDFRMVTHVVSSAAEEIGDTVGHVASLVRFSGLAFLPNDEVARVGFVSISDYTNGAGHFVLYPILSFEDGSELHIKSSGTGTIDGSKTRFVGTLQVLGGKGRYDNAKGHGKLTGTRYSPLASGADLVSEYSVVLQHSAELTSAQSERALAATS